MPAGTPSAMEDPIIDAPFAEPARRFELVAAELLAEDQRVERGRMLHSPALRVAGKSFAFATKEDIVIKLPGERVRELIASGQGRPCEIRKGSPMREWVRVQPADEEACRAYLHEAREFLASQQGR